MSEVKMNLDILNKLVDELRSTFNLALKIKEADPKDHLNYLAEASKCMGLASAITVESSALIKDFMREVQSNTVAANAGTPSPYGAIDELFDIGPLAGFSKKTNN